MKVTNKLIHKFTVENEFGDKVDVTIRPDDMVQMGFLGRALKTFNDMETIVADEDDIEALLEQVEQLTETLKAVNKNLDLAFGPDFTETAFRGSYSLVMYDEFFEGLSRHLNITEGKAKDYVKQRRRQALQDHKKPKDTL